MSLAPVSGDTTLADRFFPLIKTASVSSPLIESEVTRLRAVFQKFAASPFVFLKGGSDVFLTQIVRAYAQPKEIVCCDVAELIDNFKGDSARDRIYKVLRERMYEHSPKPFLILKNFDSAATLPAVTTTTAVAKAEEIVPEKKLNQVSTTLGIEPISNLVATGEPSRQTQLLPLAKELLEWIEKEKIPTIVIGVSDRVLQRDLWNLLEVQPLNINQTVEWLKGLFPEKKSHILPILAAFYCLKDPSRLFSVVDLTVKALTILETNPDEAMLKALGGLKPLSEIQKTLKVATAGIEEMPWGKISIEEINFSDSKNQTFPDIPSQSVLWVAENSARRREWLALQMAQQMKLFPCYWYQFSLAWQETPGSLQEQLLQEFFGTDQFKNEKVLFIEEGDLKDLSLQKIVLKGGARVICFYSPKEDSTSRLPSVAGLDLNPLHYTPPSLTLEEQKQILACALGETFENFQIHILPLYLLLCKNNNLLDETVQHLENDIDVLRDMEVEQIYRQFTEFYGKELKMSLQEIQYAINPDISPVSKWLDTLQKASEHFKMHILPLYLLFWKTNSFLETTRRLEKDIGNLSGKSVEQIYLQFTESYGKELKMSLQEIKYAINPDLTSVKYRIYRFAKSVFLNTLNLIFAPFRKMASYTTIILRKR